MTLLPTSIRAKLTITAVTVMGVLFIVLGATVQIGGRQQIMSSVDTDLARRASKIIILHQEMGRDRPPPGPDDHGPDGPRGPDGAPDGGPPRHGPPHGGPGDRDHGPESPGFRRALHDIGDPLLAIGPRFVALTPGPPIAPPDMTEPYDKSVLAYVDKHGTQYSTVTVGTQKVRVLSKRAIDTNGRRWVAQVPYPLGDIDKSIDTLNQTLLILLPIGLILTAVASLFLIRRVMLPIRDITTTADSIGAEDLSQRLTIRGSDEFADLGTTINGMLSRLEAGFTVQQQTLERLEAVLKQQRRFTADASHELKTPLAVIKANTGLLLHQGRMDADSRASIQSIDDAATRMNRLVQGLMLLAKTESGEPAPGVKVFDLKLAVQNGIDQVHRPSTKTVTYEESDEPAYVKGVESDVERVIVNLVDNACRYTEADGVITVSVGTNGASAIVTVRDNGKGIAEEHLPHLFERFYRADAARSTETGGTGLGLAICKGIVESTGGTIEIESELRKGATVVVKLPLCTES